jgi:hypothetical protein
MVRWRVWKKLLNLLIRLFGTSAVKSKRATVSPFEHVVSSWLSGRSLRNFFSLIALGAVLSVAAVALLYATTQGMAVQIAGLRTQVDPHWHRGISYLKIGLRWLRGVFHKGRKLLGLIPLLPKDPQPCFASNRAQEDFYDRIWFSRIRSLTCHP